MPVARVFQIQRSAKSAQKSVELAHLGTLGPDVESEDAQAITQINVAWRLGRHADGVSTD